ncbi:hypothetical protein [Nodularia chucula]|uniref:hypothetical protein n=1 Tax=Nodularia chucula TaxID=3093667 RepID=UPI0039C672BD
MNNLILTRQKAGFISDLTLHKTDFYILCLMASSNSGLLEKSSGRERGTGNREQMLNTRFFSLIALLANFLQGKNLKTSINLGFSFIQQTLI